MINMPDRDTKLRDIAPNFRCITHGGKTHVEIPLQYGRMMHTGLSHEFKSAVRDAINYLLKKHGTQGAIFDEYNDGQGTPTMRGYNMRRGYTVHIEYWDQVMNQTVEQWQAAKAQEERTKRNRRRRDAYKWIR